MNKSMRSNSYKIMKSNHSHCSSLLSNKKHLSLSSSKSPSIKLENRLFSTLNENYIPFINSSHSKAMKTLFLESKTPIVYKRASTRFTSAKQTQTKPLSTQPNKTTSQKQLSKLRFLSTKMINSILTESPMKNRPHPFEDKNRTNLKLLTQEKHKKDNSSLNAAEYSNHTLLPSFSTLSNRCNIPLLSILKPKKQSTTIKQYDLFNRDTSMGKFNVKVSSFDEERERCESKESSSKKYRIAEARSFKKHLTKRLQDVNMLINDLQRVRNENQEQLKTYVSHLRKNQKR